jgi:hypothetical protein
MKKVLIISAVICSITAAQAQTWVKFNTSNLKQQSELLQSLQVKELYQTTDVNLKDQLLSQSNFVINLPIGNGVFESFKVSENTLIPADLKAKYPLIKTFNGVSVSNPTHKIKLEHTYKGLSAMITIPGERIFVEEMALASGLVVLYPYNGNKVSYQRDCEVVEASNELLGNQGKALELKSVNPNQPKANNASVLRTYRLALAATAEYTSKRGGTKSAALSAMTTSMNRVNQVYEDDFSVTMVFVPDMDTLIYTNSTTDPYTNNNGATMLSQNQANIDTIIKTPNYDIGHVFSTGGGGIASLRSPCSSTRKAQGVTGLPNPVGDAFDIDYVAHEMGHQFGCNHTFNGTLGSCSGNRSSSSAFEPGSGVSIMGYAGICGTDNIANNSIPYFHTGSYEEALSFITSTGNCAASAPTGNTAPVVTSSADFYIPRNTPFVLTGSATDADGDALVYCWDEMDLGPQGAPQDSLSTSEPIFRSFSPTSSATRFFPQESDVRLNKKTKGEVLPVVARDLEFRLVVRDLRDGGGQLGFSTTTVHVVDSDPFRIKYPSDANTVPRNSTDSITWVVGNSDKAPINCQLVNIYFSQNSGQTFTLLAANQPNNGKAMVQVPDVDITTARYKVESVGTGNVFYTMNPKNFKISTVLGIQNGFTGTSLRVYPNPTQDQIVIESADINGKVNINGFNGKTVVDLSDLHSGLYFVQVENSNNQSQVVKVTKK